MQDRYRHAASMLLFRSKDGPLAQRELLLLHKPRKKDAWQLPQGGFEEGEDAIQCAVRELKEEAGIEGVEVLGKSELVYKYDFPASYRRFRPDEICGQHIEFVFAIAPEGAAPIPDGKEVDRFMWVLPADLKRHLKRKEYLALVRKLLEEASEKL